jgi:hypothetical protein
MNLARQAWDENNVARVRQLLEETAPAHRDRQRRLHRSGLGRGDGS